MVDFVGPTMEALLACSEAALEDAGRPVSRSSLVPGRDVAWDNCCGDGNTGGQLYVRAVTGFPSGPFPQHNTSTKCDAPFRAWQLAVGVIRCTPTIDDQGNPPSAAALTANTLGVMEDAHALETAIKCCLREAPRVQGVILVAWTPQGPQGGCVGGEWTVWVNLPACACPAEVNGDG